MTDQFQGHQGQALLVKRGEALPENARPMTEMEVLEVQLRRIDTHKPEKDVRPMRYGTHFIAAGSAFSSLYMNNLVRQGFRLGALKKAGTYIPTVAVSAIFAAGGHEFLVKHRILLGNEYCPTCTCLRSGVIQTGSSVVYSYIMSILTCIPVARALYTLPVPEKRSGVGAYLALLKKVSPQPRFLLSMAVANMLVGMVIARKELEVFVNHLSRPPSVSEMPMDLTTSDNENVE